MGGLSIRSVRHIGNVPRRKTPQWTMVGQDGGQSIRVGARTLLVFSDTLVATMPDANLGSRLPRPFHSSLGPREMFLPNCAGLTDGDGVQSAWRDLDYFCDGNGSLSEILPAKERERAQGIRLWPQHGIYLDGAVYLFYLGVQTVDASTIWGFRTVGAGLAVLDPNSGTCERVWKGSEWSLWSPLADDLHMGVQVVDAGEFAYVYASVRESTLTTARVARVPKSRIVRPDEYEFLSSFDPIWGAPLEEAANLGPCGSDFSVSYNEHLEKWVMFYAEPNSNLLMARTAEQAFGPFSRPQRIIGLPLESRSEMAYLVFQHSHFTQNEGKDLFLSYCQPRFTSNALIALKID